MLHKPKFTPFGVVFLVLFALFVIVVMRDTRNQVSDSEARQNDRNTSQLACMGMTFQDFLTGNQALRDASAKRDSALFRSKLTMARITELRIGERKDDDAKLRAMFKKHMGEALAVYDDVSLLQKMYVETVIDYGDASEALDKARRDYKLPDFEKVCGAQLEPRFQGAWFADIDEFNRTHQPTGLSIEER